MSDSAITVRFFAQLREILDTDSVQLEASPQMTVNEVLQTLAAKGDRWTVLTENDQRPVMIAVNQQMARADSAVKAGDEVAFFPPVTGG